MMRAMKAAMVRLIRSLGYNIQRWSDPYRFLSNYLDADSQFEILDCGAFKGDKAAVMAKLFPEANIYCFEPQPHYYELLTTRFGDTTRCVPVKLALSNREGQTEFYITDDKYTSSILAPQDSEMTVSQKVTVDVTTIDNFVANHTGNRVRFIKLDLQGNELHALEGAQKTLSTCTAILTEVNFSERYKGTASFLEVSQLLHSAGFRLIKIFDIHGASDGAWKFGDALFIREKQGE